MPAARQQSENFRYLDGKGAVVNQGHIDFFQDTGYIFNSMKRSIPAQLQLFQEQVAPMDKLIVSILPEFDFTQV